MRRKLYLETSPDTRRLQRRTLLVVLAFPMLALFCPSSLRAVSFTPASVNFGNQAVGTGSAAQTISLYNSGNAALTLNSVAITGANASDFAQSNTCGARIAGGGSCVIRVTFTPSASGARSAAITVTDSAAGSPQSLGVSGTGTAAVANLSTGGLYFNNQPVGTPSAWQIVTLYNSGNAALTLNSLAITGADASNFAASNTCGYSIPAASECSIRVTFTPSASGARSAVIALTDNARNSPQSLSVSGTGTAAVASLSPGSLSFSNQSVGTISAAQILTLSNSGNAALTLSSLAITGLDSNNFAQSNNCGYSVQAGNSCTIRVSFTPTARGARTAVLTLNDNSAGSPQTAAISGTGVQATASFSPSALNFGNEAVGSSAAAQIVTLFNGGNAALTVGSLNITGAEVGNFAQTNTCGMSIAAGASCMIRVTFTPSAMGARTASLTFMDNAGGSPQSVSVSGTGTAAVANLSPTSLYFGNQAVGTSSGAQILTLYNSGNAALALSSLTLTGADAGNFAQSSTCGASVPAGGECNIRMTFTPTISGPRTAVLTFTDNSGGGRQTVSASGTGTEAIANLSPTSLYFENQPVGTIGATQTVTLYNSGNAALTLFGLALTDTQNFAQTNTCGQSVVAGGSCTVRVTFTPKTSGARSAAVTLTHNAESSPQIVSLSGTSTQAVANLSSGSLTFANQPVGTTSAAQTLTLSNTGDTALTLSLSLSGINSNNFFETNTCGESVVAGGVCTIRVVFAPTAAGSHSAALTLTDNATGSPQTVSLSGTSTLAVASFSPGSLNFGSQSVGATTAAQTLTLSNTGSADLAIVGFGFTGTNSGDFAQTNNCGTSVTAGSSCVLRVTFTPTAAGPRSAGVIVSDNAAGSPQVIYFSGTGATAVVSLSPSSLYFASQAVGVPTAPGTVTLSNTGNAPLALAAIALAGANAGDFMQTNNCGMTIPAGGSCTLRVTFTPTASGPRSAALTHRDNSTNSTLTVSVSGSGIITAATASLSPASQVFGNCPVDTGCDPEYVTLQNTGNAALAINSITLTGANPADFTENNTCGSMLAAGASCRIAILFMPSASGTRTASLTITGGGGSPQAAALAGAGTHDVVVSWNAVLGPGQAGYNIHRGTARGAESAIPLNSSPIVGNTYTDVNVMPGQIYYYWVGVVNSSDIPQGPASNEASCTVPSP